MKEYCTKWFYTLKNGDWTARCSVVEEISSLSDRSQVFAVISSLEHENWVVREAVASGLSGSPDETVHAAVEESMNISPWFLPYALRVLRRVGRTPETGSLVAGLSSDDPFIRRTALRVSGRTGGCRAVH